MQEPLKSPCDDTLELIEPYLDGDLSGKVVLRFERHVADCETCTAELRWAGRIRSGLRQLSPQVCPARVVERVVAEAQAVSRFDLRSWLRPAFVWRPALAAALLVALVVFVPGLLTPPDQTPVEDLVELEGAEFERAELERAEREARWALALLADLNRRTGVALRDDVLRKRLGDAPRHALARAIRLQQQELLGG